METGKVKITNTGTGGKIRHMKYDRKVADFNTFIKSPEKYIKGTSVKTNNTISHKPGDLEMKNLHTQIKYVGEQITKLAAEVKEDPSKATALNEKVAELNDLNKKLFEYAQAEGETSTAPKVDPETEKQIKDKLASMSPEELESLGTELEDVKAKLGVEDLTNTVEVANAINAQGSVEESIKLDEGLISLLVQGWDRFKEFLQKNIQRLGWGATLAGIVSAGYGQHLMEEVMSNMPPGVEMTPNAWVIAGGAAFVLGIVASAYGAYKKNPGKSNSPRTTG